MFFHGEDAVADDLAPFIDAAPREEQKYFLATQQVDEARHAIFFKRFLHEVVGRGDGIGRGRPARHRAGAHLGLSQDVRAAGRGHRRAAPDRSRVALARAVTMYHIVVEALLAQPGQHFISDYLGKRELLPGFREGMRLIALDEQRHIGFGVKLLHDLARGAGGARRRRRPDPRGHAVLARGLHPARLGPLLHRVLRLHAGGDLHRGRALLRAKLRSAGLPLEELPARRCSRWRCPRASAPSTAWRCCARASSARRNGAPPRDPAAMELLFGSVARAVDHRTAPAGPFIVQWEFPDAEPWHVRVENGSTAAAAGRARHVDLELRCASRTGSTSSPAASTRAARWPRAGCARTARRARCGPRAGSSD